MKYAALLVVAIITIAVWVIPFATIGNFAEKMVGDKNKTIAVWASRIILTLITLALVVYATGLLHRL